MGIRRRRHHHGCDENGPMEIMKMSNKGVQGTLHKVSGPLTPDVGH